MLNSIVPAARVVVLAAIASFAVPNLQLGETRADVLHPGAPACSVQAPDDARGKVLAVKLEKNQLAVQDATGRELTFQVEMSCKVILNNKEVELSDLRPGDDAAVSYEPQEDILMAREVRCTR